MYEKSWNALYQFFASIRETSRASDGFEGN